MIVNYSGYGKKSLFVTLKLVHASSQLFFLYSKSRITVVKIGPYLMYIMSHNIEETMQVYNESLCNYPKKHGLGQVVTQIVGHVDTVCGMKQMYTRTTLKSKYVNMYMSKWFDLVTIQPKKANTVADLRNSTRKAS